MWPQDRPTPALIALEVRGHSGLSYFVWDIVFRLDYIRYVELALNIEQRKCFDEKSSTSRLVFVTLHKFVLDQRREFQNGPVLFYLHCSGS